MRLRTNLVMLSACILLTSSPVLVAAEEDAPFNPFAGNIGNAIWTLAIFGVVVWVLRRFAWGPMLAGLQRRERFIQDSLETAKQDRQAAEARLREYEQRLAKAHDEAVRIIEEGRRAGEVTRRKLEEEARAASDVMLERAKREIGVARDTVLRDLYDRSAEMASGMAGAILKRQVSPEDHARLVKEALAELDGQQPG